MGVWARQTLLNTDRFTALAAEVVDEPVIIAPISDRVSTQVVESLDIEARVAEALPGPSTVLAPAIANAVRDAIDSRLQQALANPQFQQALPAIVSTTHGRVVALLRDESTNLTVIDGYVYLNVFPIVGTALAELQAMGLIPAIRRVAGPVVTGCPRGTRATPRDPRSASRCRPRSARSS